MKTIAKEVDGAAVQLALDALYEEWATDENTVLSFQAWCANYVHDYADVHGQDNPMEAGDRRMFWEAKRVIDSLLYVYEGAGDRQKRRSDESDR